MSKFRKILGKIDKVFCFPGNAGTAEIAENIIIRFRTILKILKTSF